MFGSKKNKTTSKVDVSIETMNDDVKGTGAKNVSVEYDKSNPADGNVQGKKPATTANEKKDENKDGAITSSVAHQPIGESPFKNGTAESLKEPQVPQAPSTNNSDQPPHGLPKGTFSMPNVNTQENNKEKNIPSFSTNPTLSSKTDNSTEKPFLHQTTDKINNNTTNQLKTDALSKSTSKKSGISSIIWVISFILLLGTILLGAYYFYMKKSDKTPTPPANKNQQDKTKQPTATTNQNSSKTVNPKQTTTTNKQPEKPQSAQNTLPNTFKTSEATFFDDLGQFILTLKNSGNEKALRGGIIVTPMLDASQQISAQTLVKKMGMDKLLQGTDLKPACKLFIMQDADKIRTALVFELANGVDDKIIKENIIKNEQTLPVNMSKLFINETKSATPATIKFSVNADNLNSRYFNYKPGDTFTSVDWNILDLGQGKILYFATSKNLAEKVTNYFMSLVVK